MKNSQKLEILQKLISIPSVNDHEKQVAEYLQSLLQTVGINSEILPLDGDRANLVAEIGSGKPVLAVTGHMDVVDVERENWQTDPFELTQKGDRLYGRGSTDMKAGLAALVITLMELKEQQVPLNGTVRLLATAGEEVGQQGAQKLFEAGYMNDVDTLLVAEPSGFRVPYASKGELDLHIKSRGKAAHSSMPKLGNNAVEHLINVLNNIKESMQQAIDDATNEVLGDTVFNIDTFHGGSQDNAIPGFAEAVLNIRTIPELDNQKILAIIQQQIDQYNQSTNGEISMEIGMDIVPIVGKKDSKIIKLIQQIAQPYLKQYSKDQHYTAENLQKLQQMASLSGMEFSKDQLLTMGVSGGTDASKLLIDKPTGANYVMFGPGNDNPHQDNEYVSLEMYQDFIEIYQKLIIAFFKD
ncbi:ArgE/DapE family deacylase [Bombilactobacillus thymidiniphilus]|uniref:Probable succinyl-diaminopimelate desuccinylase n=1 Tax=Bombilactobacillus thymidiniphilus TaxID=2923363 RepID=A0ABY4PDW3_9LACO|nr:ArgE/DapE family deacylase [Bombilactobacillus thymidiniphilus]UQS83691.1 ArgE/DapE family deacylase [Bombilactobacillus thymidiniphilus]